MSGIQIRPSEKSFVQRFIQVVVYFGIPMIALELIFVPHGYWAGGLVYLLPSTVIGLAAATFVEHSLFRYIWRRTQGPDK
jgi:hypothetical protein